MRKSMILKGGILLISILILGWHQNGIAAVPVPDPEGCDWNRGGFVGNNASECSVQQMYWKGLCENADPPGTWSEQVDCDYNEKKGQYYTSGNCKCNDVGKVITSVHNVLMN